MLWFFFFKQKTAYEMRISDWSSDVCSSDLLDHCVTRLIPDKIEYNPENAKTVAKAIKIGQIIRSIPRCLFTGWVAVGNGAQPVNRHRGLERIIWAIICLIPGGLFTGWVAVGDGARISKIPPAPAQKSQR